MEFNIKANWKNVFNNTRKISQPALGIISQGCSATRPEVGWGHLLQGEQLISKRDAGPVVRQDQTGLRIVFGEEDSALGGTGCMRTDEIQMERFKVAFPSASQ